MPEVSAAFKRAESISPEKPGKTFPPNGGSRRLCSRYGTVRGENAGTPPGRAAEKISVERAGKCICLVGR